MTIMNDVLRVKSFCSPGIYSLYDLKSNQVYYVGKSKRLISDIESLLVDLSSSSCSNSSLQFWFNKRKNSFAWCILSFCTLRDLNNQYRIHVQGLKPLCNGVWDSCPICGKLISKGKYCSRDCYQTSREGKKLNTHSEVYKILQEHKEEVKEYYSTHTAKETSKKFLLSEEHFDKVNYWLRSQGIKKS